MDWNSYFTRKVMLGGGAVLVVVLCWLATQYMLKAAEYYGTMVTAVSAIYATYCGANIAQDHIMTRNQPAIGTHPIEPLPPADQ